MFASNMHWSADNKNKKQVNQWNYDCGFFCVHLRFWHICFPPVNIYINFACACTLIYTYILYVYAHLIQRYTYSGPSSSKSWPEEWKEAFIRFWDICLLHNGFLTFSKKKKKVNLQVITQALRFRRDKGGAWNVDNFLELGLI